ncbi:MAG: FAD:protein FMN transferase [Verrucomicrobia bacterium]|nr:FAD:protein FMN transferase [Verrucomicrobiota bacterium]
MRVSGSPPGEEAWTVQLEDHHRAGKRTIIRLRDAAISTSGNYENYFEAGGRRYSHIIDPRSGLPVGGIASCSVIAPTCTESDAWATACFVLGPTRSDELLGDRYPRRFIVLDSKGEGVVDREVKSRGFPRSP